MASLTQPLRDEHKGLLPHIERLATVADSVGDGSMETLRTNVDAVSVFLTHQLIPHAQAEDKALYPVVAQLMGAPQATATMRRDHSEVGRLTEELAALRAQLTGASLAAAQAKALRRVLYGLYALLKLHFTKEEEVYLPLLEAKLSPQAAHQLFTAMEQAAHEAPGHP